MSDLRPYQQADLDFLTAHPRSALWDEAGVGKTRPLLHAAEGQTLVIAPAAVRDTEVWELEAQRIGIEPPQVISYHAAAKPGYLAELRPHTLILDESQWIKERKVSWGEPIYDLAQRTARVHEATGTPMPNNAQELWGQLRLIRPQTREMKHYWPWVRTWFDDAPTRFSKFAMSENLKGCRCRDPDDLDAAACEHWQAFHTENIAGYAIRHLRDEVMKDLPPLSGDDTPLWTPMTSKQRKLYTSLEKDFLASLPSEGIVFEALTDSAKFTAMCQLASGLSVLDLDLDPKDKESGKITALRDTLASRQRPTVVTVWYKNSAAAVARVCKDLKLSHVMMGSKTTRPQRRDAVQQFSAGGIDVMIASIGVIREGIDGLQYASDETVLFERSWVPGHNEQVIRRLHRLGQQRPVTARQLVTPGSTDSAQWDQIIRKGSHIGRVLSPVEVATILRATQHA